ncbi:hypothetical protein [Geodermatophilus sp. SYSU D00698]
MSAPTFDDRLADVVLRLGVLTDPDDGLSRTAAATLSRLERRGPPGSPSPPPPRAPPSPR